MTASPPVHADEAGFALGEILIALIIVAAALGVTYEAVEAGARTRFALRAERAALPVAQSVLARVGSDIALAPGVMDGTDGSQAWRVEIERYGDSEVREVDAPTLLDVRVRVHPADRARPVVELRTLRLAS